ncbi:MAG: hypothetical protein IKX75_07185, partial [Desulfovibrio sp.]|nr:hypothetical protein [Desulfovibrio sp.]
MDRGTPALHLHLAGIELVGQGLGNDGERPALALAREEVPAAEVGDPEAQAQHLEADHDELPALALDERGVRRAEPLHEGLGLDGVHPLEDVAGRPAGFGGIAYELAGEAGIVRREDGGRQVERGAGMLRPVGYGGPAGEMMGGVAPVPPQPEAGVLGSHGAHPRQGLGVTPVYHTLREEGPDHDKHFEVGLYIGEKLLATGKGHSKQDAQTEAAKQGVKK